MLLLYMNEYSIVQVRLYYSNIIIDLGIDSLLVAVNCSTGYHD